MVVVVSHSRSLLSACRMIMALDRGRLAKVGPPHELVPGLAAPEAQPMRLSSGDS
jgi:ABC-type protease/lipase transport system fused ATPase/permease subunit